MKLAGIGVSYLLLRELPIRNFYARSLIMAYVAYKLSKNYYFNPLTGLLIDKGVMHTPEHYNKQYEIYDNVNWGMKYGSLNQDGLSALDIWKLKQPGFVNDSYKGGLAPALFYIRKKKEIMWDGTMNQPVLAMNNKLHKNNYGY